MRAQRLLLCAAALLVAAASGCRHTAPSALTDKDRARLHLSRGEFDRALPLLEAEHRAAPADLDVARELTLAHVRTHRGPQLVARLEAALQGSLEVVGRPEHVTWYMLGLARFSTASEAEGALRAFEEAAALAPSEPELHYRLGLALLESERFADALPPLQRAQQLAPDRRELLLPLARAKERTGDRAGAVAALRSLVAAGPTPEEVATARALMEGLADPFARFPLAARARLEEGLLWLHERDLPQQALLSFEEILLEYPDLAVVHQLLGLCYQKVDDSGRAVEAFKRAIELAPEDGRGHLYLALLYQSRQRPEQALPHFRRALELNPLLDDAYLAVGEHHLGRGELQQAQAAFSALRHLQPLSVPARGKYALVLQLRGDFPAADRELRQVVEQDPQNVEFMLRLGILHLERRKQARAEADRADATREAELWLRKVLSLQPQNALASRALQSLQAQ